MDLHAWSDTRRDALDRWMASLFQDAWPPSFAEPCRYPVFGGGKRIRPLLAIATFEALTASPVEAVFPPAAAVELVHTYSLVHDDLPCMDDDDERRGRPTVHRKWDEATAVLSGDALLTEAFAVLTRADVPAALAVTWVRELTFAAGYRGMVGGQAADIGLGAKIQDPAILTRLHRLKTGALIRAAVRMGAHTAGADADTLARLTTYGEQVGLAFQLADDLLDADEAEDEDGPPSFVRLLGIDGTRAEAERLSEEAHTIAASFDATVLMALARFTVERDV